MKNSDGINGVKKIVYRKVGKSKNYVCYKNKKIGLEKYKMIIKNKLKRRALKQRGGKAGSSTPATVGCADANQYMLGVFSDVKPNPTTGGKKHRKKGCKKGGKKCKRSTRRHSK